MKVVKSESDGGSILREIDFEELVIYSTESPEMVKIQVPFFYRCPRATVNFLVNVCVIPPYILILQTISTNKAINARKCKIEKMATVFFVYVTNKIEKNSKNLRMYKILAAET